MKTKYISGLASILALSLITACGDDSSSASAPETSYEKSSSSAKEQKLKPFLN